MLVKVDRLTGASMLWFFFASFTQHAVSNKMHSDGNKVLLDDLNPLLSVAFFGAARDQWGQSFKLRTHGAVHTCITATPSRQVILTDCAKSDRSQCFKYKRGTKMLQAFGLGSSSDAIDWDCLHTQDKATTSTLGLVSCDSCGDDDCKITPSFPDNLGYFTLSALRGKIEAGTGHLALVDNNATGTAVRFYSDYEEDCRDEIPKAEERMTADAEVLSAAEPSAASATTASTAHSHAEAEMMMAEAEATAAENSAKKKIAQAEGTMAEGEAAAAEISAVPAKDEEKKAAQGQLAKPVVSWEFAAAEDAAKEVIGKLTEHAKPQGSNNEIETLANVALARQHKKA
eukprot:TRINITY_DN105930_c0_g1_i1.p1 TRINITY_DN105930_c0_g1~~TRINITY_DN105930_c0_g1_i1.p1  ORF type:complete len:343 (+),score=80.72 TRINITY_DN105930_c0_g1_i1:55-1083(+)